MGKSQIESLAQNLNFLGYKRFKSQRSNLKKKIANRRLKSQILCFKSNLKSQKTTHFQCVHKLSKKIIWQLAT